jgi:hypothetical protein
MSTTLMAFLVAVSIVGLVFVPVLVLQPNLPNLQLTFGHYLVGALYMALCFLGVAAALYPSKCQTVFQKTQNPMPPAKLPTSPIGIRGHHPDCRNFSGNRIRVRRRVVCAACSGLLVGAIFASVGTVFHFFAGLNMALGSIWMVAFGEGFMLTGLAQINFAGYVKSVANLVFVLGSFILLVEVDVLGRNVLFDLYVLGLIGFMLSLRILLSEWKNTRVCRACLSCFQ